MDYIKILADPIYVAKLQKFCGVEIIPPVKCDQETQTKSQSSSDSEDSELVPPKHEINGNLIPPHQLIDNNSIDPYMSIDPAERDSESSGGNLTVTRSDTSVTSTRQRLVDRCQHVNGVHPGHSHVNNVHHVTTRSNTTNSHTSNRSHIDRRKGENLKNGFHIVNGKYDVNDKYDVAIKSCGERDVIFSCGEKVTSSEKTDQQTAPAPVQPVEFTIKYKSLYYLALFGAFLGNEQCFLSFFPFCIWNLDLLIVRQVRNGHCYC